MLSVDALALISIFVLEHFTSGRFLAKQKKSHRITQVQP